MDIEKLIERLKCPQIHSCPMGGEYPSCTACQKQITQEAAEALQYLSEGADEVNAALQEQIVENARLRKERDELAEDFVDYVTGGVPNPSIYCANRKQSCVDMRGWCTGKNCDGFSPKAKHGPEKED